MYSSESERIPKRIIICCDGTWQSAVSGLKISPSNVTRLARSIPKTGKDKNGKKWNQIVWYDSGVGTTSMALERKIEGAIGLGVEGNVIEAYTFIALNWEPGDQVMCFGFSRGAYTARSIAGLISDVGICKPRDLAHFPALWDHYKASKPGQRFDRSDTYYDWLYRIPPGAAPGALETSDNQCDWEVPVGDPGWTMFEESKIIEVVGVFDTVGALGLPHILGHEVNLPFGPDKPGYHNVGLSPNIKRAYHALALDEHREAFTPTLWHLPDRPARAASDADLARQKALATETERKWFLCRRDAKISNGIREQLRFSLYEAKRRLKEMEDSRRPESRLLQVWFAGVHTNIGGGTVNTLKNIGDMEELSNITYAWLLDQISDYISLDNREFSLDAEDRKKRLQSMDSRSGSLPMQMSNSDAAFKNESLLDTMRRHAHEARAVVHNSVQAKRDIQGWGVGEIIDSFKVMYWVNGSKRRTPGQYAKDKFIPAPGRTHEQIHPSVGYRMANTQDKGDRKRYVPCFLDLGQVKRQESRAGGYEYIINGVVLPEYRIKPMISAEDFSQLPYEKWAMYTSSAANYASKLDFANNHETDDQNFQAAIDMTPEQRAAAEAKRRANVMAYRDKAETA